MISWTVMGGFAGGVLSFWLGWHAGRRSCRTRGIAEAHESVYTAKEIQDLRNYYRTEVQRMRMHRSPN